VRSPEQVRAVLRLAALALLVGLSSCGARRPAAPAPRAASEEERRAGTGGALEAWFAVGEREGESGVAPAPSAPDGPEPSIARLPPPIRVPLDVEAAIDAAVADAIAQRRIPGCVVALGRRDGIAFLRAYGVRAREPENEPNDVDTIYDLASLTKPIATATAIAILAERGALSFDDPVVRHLPAFRGGGLRDQVTIRRLLTHTSGLPAIDPLRAYEGRTREESIARILALPLEATPGARTLYSDLGFVILGEIVAAASGRSLESFVRDEILGPLGMRDSGYLPDPALRARIAPTERAARRGGVMIRGEVHDPRAFRLGGVSGHAGLFASAPDLARFARAMLGEGELEGRRILAPESVRALVTPTRLADGVVRGLGWDLRSPEEARAFGGMSEAAYGHLGWTGASIRIDPRLDVFVIVLSNDVHPDGRGDVRPLAASLERIAARAAPRILPPPTRAVLAGIDVEHRDGMPSLRGLRVVLLTHDAARARDGRRTLDVLAAAPDVEVLRVLAPEHGLGVDREGAVGDGRDAATGLPVYSVFGATRRPTDAMLEGADAVVVDLVSVGVRFYTYGSTLHETLAAVARRPGMRVIVLDRPDPLGGAIVEGPSLDPAFRSFVNHHPLALRHGLTMGELARLLDGELGLGLGERLVVVRVEGWQRGETALDLGARWVPPSPNLPDAEAALLYPAVALLEGADVSVGRGTDAPFGLLGAPWMDSEGVLAELRRVHLPGVEVERARFVPRAARHRGRSCQGVRLRLRDPAAYQVLRTGLALVRAVLAVHRDRIDLDRVARMLGRRDLIDALLEGVPIDVVEERARRDAVEFAARRAPYLCYP
jgi:uncharacterized protein YbbC (DUF1343 family)